MKDQAITPLPPCSLISDFKGGGQWMIQQIHPKLQYLVKGLKISIWTLVKVGGLRLDDRRLIWSSDVLPPKIGGAERALSSSPKGWLEMQDRRLKTSLSRNWHQE